MCKCSLKFFSNKNAFRWNFFLFNTSAFWQTANQYCDIVPPLYVELWECQYSWLWKWWIITSRHPVTVLVRMIRTYMILCIPKKKSLKLQISPRCLTVYPMPCQERHKKKVTLNMLYLCKVLYLWDQRT